MVIRPSFTATKVLFIALHFTFVLHPTKADDELCSNDRTCRAPLDLTCRDITILNVTDLGWKSALDKIEDQISLEIPVLITGLSESGNLADSPEWARQWHTNAFSWTFKSLAKLHGGIKVPLRSVEGPIYSQFSHHEIPDPTDLGANGMRVETKLSFRKFLQAVESNSTSNQLFAIGDDIVYGARTTHQPTVATPTNPPTYQPTHQTTKTPTKHQRTNQPTNQPIHRLIHPTPTHPPNHYPTTHPSTRPSTDPTTTYPPIHQVKQ